MNIPGKGNRLIMYKARMNMKKGKVVKITYNNMLRDYT